MAGPWDNQYGNAPAADPNAMGPNPFAQTAFDPAEGYTEDDITVIEEEDGGMTLEYGDLKDKLDVPFGTNLAEVMEEGPLDELAAELVEAFTADRDSRKEWEKSYIKGLDLLGLTFEDRTTPWDGACGVFHPMLSEAVVRFQAQTIQEVFPAKGPAKTQIVGKITDERTAQAGRVEGYLNHLTTKTMSEYRNETERLLFSLPIAGSSFRKVYYDNNLGRIASMFVPAEDFVVAYGIADLTTCERATHIMKKTPNQVRKLQVSGFYLDEELDDPVDETSPIQKKYNELNGETDTFDFDDQHTLLEMQVDLDLEGFEDENGIALPYVVTVEKSSKKILSIYRNYLEDDESRLKREHFVHYQYLPGLGFYGFGLVHMIGGLSKSATSLLRQLIDAGTLANLPGGLKARGLRIKGDDSPIMPGEFRDVDIPGGAIRDNIAFLPYKEPSTVLYQLLSDIVQEGRRFASAADIKAADMNGEAPVGTTLALLEREMKTLSAIQARVHHSMGKELQLISDLIHSNGPGEYPYEVDGDYTIEQDFDARVDVIPVSDPNAGTMAQRIMQYQAALALAAQAPGIYDMPRLHRQMLEVLGIQDADKVVPLEDDMHPTDPISENEALLTGKPIKVFRYQDHEAHIQAHQAAAQNPELQAALKQNPMLKSIQANAAAHVAEHVAMQYRRSIEEELGVPMPDPGEPMPEDIELRLSQLVAPAAAQLTGKAKQKAQAAENEKNSKDPIIQQAEKKLELEDKKISGDHQLGVQKQADHKALEGAKLAAKVAADTLRAEEARNKLDSEDQRKGFDLGMKLVQQFEAKEQQAQQAQQNPPQQGK
jgi:hypothetical protein